MIKHSGLLVVLEGIDNSGKTTQIKRIADWLRSQGHNALISRELSTGIGKCFKAEFETGELSPRVKALLFAADRYHRIETEIIPALERGVVVLADRWTLSSLVYRSVEGSGLSLAEFVNKEAITPDVIFLIDIDPKLAYHRGQMANRQSPYSEEFLSLARRKYLELATGQGITIIDGSQSIEKMTEDIVRHLAHLLLSQRISQNETSSSTRS